MSINAYGDALWRQAQVARSSWKKGRLLRDMGRLVEGDAYLEKAMRIRHELVPDDDREEKELMDQDWDKLIFYYSR
jgi:hypothetical protein